MAPRTQDLIFTLYGDHIRQRGGEARTASLILLLGCLGVSEQATRSALSRMARKGWLSSRREGRLSFYSLTDKAITLLEEGAQRIFHPRHDPWDRRWHIVTYSIPETLSNKRDRLRTRLTWLGFGRLGPGTWISPRDRRAEVEEALRQMGLSEYVEWFSGVHHGFGDDSRLVERGWNLDRLNQTYAAFISRFEPRLARFDALLKHDAPPHPADFYVERFWLVHEYRSFPYVDPNLPPELLPGDWLGYRAEAIFKAYYELLSEKAEQFVDEALQITEDNV